jgi:uncharacterized protein (DUF1697 family)
MRFAALLRGINVGKTKRIDMKNLKALFEAIGYHDVSTYINSGNVLFETSESVKIIVREIEQKFETEFGFKIPALVKSSIEMNSIVKKIPSDWVNDDTQRTDVAYLFDEADSKDIIDSLPIKKEFLNILYVKGALVWNVKRENYNKSHLNKLIGHKFYQFMTVRNVNTARHLAEMMRQQ